MEQSGCSRGSMVLSPEKIGSACGRSLGQLEDCGRSHGVKEAISIQLCTKLKEVEMGGSPQL